jgi:hypothetical protein
MIKKLKRKIKKKVVGYVFAGFVAGKIETTIEPYVISIFKRFIEGVF